MWSRLGNDDLIGIGIYDEIGVVGDNDHLSVRFCLDEEVDQFVKDRFWVEIFFRLVDHQRPIIAVVEREVEQHQAYTFGTALNVREHA